MNRQCTVANCIWSDADTFCDILTRISVPLDSKWPLVILFLRGVRELDTLSEVQKARMQELLMAVTQKKDFSPQGFRDVEEQFFSIITANYEEKLRSMFRETTELAKDMSQLFGKRREDLVCMAATADTHLASGVNPAGVLATLRDTLKDIVIQMQRDVQELEGWSLRDSLSGLSNRRAFDAFLDNAVKVWQEERQPLSLLLMDIDNFKTFNDSYGHLVGDQVLRALGLKLNDLTQEMFGTSDLVLAARYGGEEFAVILRGEMAARASELAERIRAGVEQSSLRVSDAEDRVLHRGLKVTISVGVAAMHEGWRGAYQKNLIDFADKALYYAKLKGKNLAIRHDPESKRQFSFCSTEIRVKKVTS